MCNFKKFILINIEYSCSARILKLVLLIVQLHLFHFLPISYSILTSYLLLQFICFVLITHKILHNSISIFFLHLICLRLCAFVWLWLVRSFSRTISSISDMYLFFSSSFFIFKINVDFNKIQMYVSYLF